MARDRDILSDNEYFRQVTDIVEHIIGKKIELTNFNDENYVQWRETKYRMNISSPARKHIQRITALSHECGHLLGKSPILEAKGRLTQWSKGSKDRFNMYWYAFNIIEDQRIEYFIMNLWKANKDRFLKTRKKLGTDMTDCSNGDPVSELLAIRFYRDELVTSKRKETFQNVLKVVEGTGRMGAYKLLCKIKPLLDEWYDDYTTRHAYMPNIEQPNRSTFQDYSKETTRPQISKDGKVLTYEMIFEDTAQEKTNDGKTDIETLEKLVADDKVEFEEDMEQISIIIADKTNTQQPQLNRKYKLILRPTVKPEYDERLGKNIKKFLRTLQEAKTDSIDYDGEDVNIESYIENKITGKDVTKVMNKQRTDNGVSVVLSIDGSGSMYYDDNMTKARNLAYTMMKSVENVRGIDIQVNVWSSNAMGDVGITDIRNIKDTNMINMYNGYGLTPTHLALEYSALQLDKMKGHRKLLIMITDGRPEYRSRKYMLGDAQMIRMCKKSLQKARRKTNNITCILLKNSRDNTTPRQTMEEIFGKKRFIQVSNFTGVTERVIKDFKQMIIRSMK